MANKRSAAAQKKTLDDAPSKQQLQRQMERTRDSLAETVGVIKETVEQEVMAVKNTVSGVLDFREEFKNEPLILSMGALSAGFALGYTVGYAHKNSKGGKQSPMTAFANTMMGDLTDMGNELVLPALDSKIKEMFGFEFSGMLEKIRGSKKAVPKKKALHPRSAKSLAKAKTKTTKQIVTKKKG